ncbi:MAG TPA: hypothetical protein VFW77_01040 [Candidatus Saccharimonadales bacterium]|nr:hypothetical protein [Candidatus Saccharimonadales bacterium]
MSIELEPGRSRGDEHANPKYLIGAAITLAAVGGWQLSEVVDMAKAHVSETTPGFIIGVPVAKYSIASAYLMMKEGLEKIRGRF